MKKDKIGQSAEETNKKLLYARLILELLERQEKPYRAALKESYIAHLMSAYDCFVDEIQVRLNLAPQSEPNPVIIAQYMKRAGISTMAEMNMLVRLEENSYSWLNQLRRLYAELQDGDDRGQLLNASPVERYNLEDYLMELEKLVKQLRFLMCES